MRSRWIWTALQLAAVSCIATAAPETPLPSGAITMASRLRGDAIERFEVSNLPRARSAGQSPFCMAYAMSYLLQHRYCAAQGIGDCSQATPDQEINPLSVLAYTERQRDGREFDTAVSYRSLNLHTVAVRYFPDVAPAVGHFKADSCFPADAWLNNFASEADYSQRIDDIGKVYELYRPVEGASSDCADCDALAAKALRALTGVERSAADTHQALASPTTGEFVYRTLFAPSSCQPIVLQTPKARAMRFPADPAARPPMATVLAKALQLLSTRDAPVVLRGLCTDRNRAGQCVGSHSIALTGFEMDVASCAPDFGPGCRFNIKVLNSAGQKWQDKYQGGWLDGPRFFANLGEKNGSYALYWLQ
jgi:hypothetical protein